MQVKAVLMNDTGRGAHFGCDRVMRVIGTNLTGRGIAITARSRVGNRWFDDKAFLEAADAADIIVINGEGTCHHGRPNAEKLLRVVDHPVAQNKPVALINALYQENPPEWRRYLDKIDVISPRDSWSAGELSNITGRKIEYLPDMSMAEGFNPKAGDRSRDLLTIGESVLPETSDKLIEFAQEHPQTLFLPLIATLKSTKPRYPWPLRQLRNAYANAHRFAFKLSHRNSVFCRDEFEFADYLLKSHLHISGRFHAICFSVTTKTPFLALTSNAWKIEALVEDLGISKSRIVSATDLDELIRSKDGHAFTDKERDGMEAALVRGVHGTKALYDNLADLARERKRVVA